MTCAVASKLAAATALAGVLLVPEPAAAQFNYEIVHTFPTLPAYPNTKLVQGTDGTFYGTTAGQSNWPAVTGTVFALRPKSEGGFSLTILHEFDTHPSKLIQARDGNLYGTTVSTSLNSGFGTVFKISPAGVFTTLHTFTGADGGNTRATLVEATDGSFYGTTPYGGAANLGTVFRMTADGALTTVHSFTGGSDGSNPYEASLIQAADGAFYGTTFASGPPDPHRATMFKITPDGTLTTLHTFGEFDAYASELVQGTDGNFYGTIGTFGGQSGNTAFKLTPSGIFTHLHTFDAFSDGVGAPSDSLIQMSDGNFYGTMGGGGPGTDGAFGRGTVFRMTPAGDITVLHTFTGTDGEYPSSGLILARDGLLYGVLSGGRFDALYDLDLGGVFSTDTAGGITPVYAFQNHEAGCNPWGGLIQGSDGALYGTTRYGGTANRGTAYRLTGDGTVTTLHSFTGYPDEGASPLASLLQASDGNFYGTTNDGGNLVPFSRGTVFRMTPKGAVTTLHSFPYNPFGSPIQDGNAPWAPLIQASDGILYGTTPAGGLSFMGTLFRISLSGDYESFYTFNGWPTGAPHGPLIQARDGFLYGTGAGGRPQDGGSIFRVASDGPVLLGLGGMNNYITAGLTEGSDGTFYSTSFGDARWPPTHGPQPAGSVFKITPGGVKTVLHTFNFGEGVRPFNAPIIATDGNLYGTTHRYRIDIPLLTWGSIYRVTPSGNFTTLKVVTYPEGAHPSGKLLQASDGSIYGVSYMGGIGDCGLIFRFTIPQASLPAVRAARHGHR